MEVRDCTMRCALEVLAPDGALLGNAKVKAQLAAMVPASTPAERVDAAARFMRIAMARLDTAFDEAIRRNLDAYLADRRSVGRARRHWLT